MWREPDGALGDGTRVFYDDGPASPARVAGLIAGVGADSGQAPTRRYPGRQCPGWSCIPGGGVTSLGCAGAAYPVAE
jgi:hypothetical protein